MQPEKWQTVVGNIKDNFKVEEEDKYHVDEEGGVDVEHIVFTGPLGRLKLEFVSRPIVVDKKTTYNNRIGSETKVDYVYSEEEKSHKLTAYKWDESIDDWVEMDAKNFDL